MKAARRLLVLGAGPEQIEALRIARELGFRTVAFDNQEHPAGRAFADEFFQVDLKDREALVGQAEVVAPDGVFVHAAELAVEAAQVSEALDLPGLSVEVATRATDKSLRIEALAGAGLATPGFEILEAGASLDTWLERVESNPYPRVLKPTDQAGARGVEHIASRSDLEGYYARRGQFDCPRFVCEAKLDGLQLSTESVALHGKVLHHAIALRHYDTTATYHPYFIEDGHSLPFDLAPERQAEVEGVIERCFAALAIRDGVLKGDLLISESGEIFVLEMAARTSGGRFADTVVPLGTGVNILYPLIELAMNEDLSRDWFNPTRRIGVSQRFFLHPKACEVTRWPRLRELVGRPGVSDWRIDDAMFQSGRLPDVRNHRDRFGYVICTGETREQADALALDITSAFSAGLEFQTVAGRTPS